MKHYGLEIPEGTGGVTNLTAPTGTSFPAGTENAGELFFRTDTNALYVHGTGVAPDWIDLTETGGGGGGGSPSLSWPLLAPDGTSSAPSYSWEDETNSGMYRPDIQTITTVIDGSDAFSIIKDTGTSPGPSGVDPSLAASTATDLHIVNEAFGDTSIRIETVSGLSDAQLHLINPSQEWMFVADAIELSMVLSLDSVEVLRVDQSGRLKVAGGSPGYETLVDDDDVIPNKRYVDISVAGGIAGSNGEIQFNDNGTHGASEFLTWDGSTFEVGQSLGSPLGSPEPPPSVIVKGNIQVNERVEASDGTEIAPTYSFSNEDNTGWYRPEAQTVSLTIAEDETFRIQQPGGLGSVSPGSPTGYPANTGIDFYLKNDVPGDSSIRLETDSDGDEAYLELITSTGTWRLSNNNEGGSPVLSDLVLTSGGGVIRVVSTTAYETLVVDDDDIPNKKYVDDTMADPVLNSYTVAGLPGSPSTGQLAYVSDETGGAQPAFYDGTDWRRFTDRAIVS